MAKLVYERLRDILYTSLKKTVVTSELRNTIRIKEYLHFYKLMSSAVVEGIISPVKASGTNGMQPVLFNRYHVNRDRFMDTEQLKRELLTLHPRLNITYYQRHPEIFQIDKAIVLVYNDFFQKGILPEKIERRELSFLLFSEEKKLESATQQYKVLKRLGLDLERDFNCFDRRQPFTWFPFSNTVKTVLIVENLTPFYDIFLILKSLKGKTPFDAIVFGGGRHINSSFSFFYDLFEETDSLNLFYWGDIDATGLNIYFSLKENSPEFVIKLWKEGYVAMIKTAKTKQNKTKSQLKDYNAEDDEAELLNQLRQIIENGLVIPQESLNYSDIEGLLCT